MGTRDGLLTHSVSSWQPLSIMELRCKHAICRTKVCISNCGSSLFLVTEQRWAVKRRDGDGHDRSQLQQRIRTLEVHHLSMQCDIEVVKDMRLPTSFQGAWCS